MKHFQHMGLKFNTFNERKKSTYLNNNLKLPRLSVNPSVRLGLILCVQLEVAIPSIVSKNLIK